MEKAKEKAFKAFQSTLPFLHRRKKCQDYGKEETAETMWAKLPKVSKLYWLKQTT